MIKNDKQYQVTRKKLGEFKEALKNLENNKALSSEEINLRSRFILPQLEIFEDELKEYEELKNGVVVHIAMNTLGELSDALIKARIAKGWSQADLADKLGLQAQAVQRYEATDYESADLTRLIEVFHALELQWEGKVRLAEPRLFLSPQLDVDYNLVTHFVRNRKGLIDIKNEPECVP